MASPGFVARRNTAGDYVMGHSRWTSGPDAADCSITNSFVTNAVLMDRAVSCWHLHQLISQTTQYLDSLLSDLLQSELKMKLLEVEGARAPVPHSWRRPWTDWSTLLRLISAVIIILFYNEWRLYMGFRGAPTKKPFPAVLCPTKFIRTVS